MATLVASIDDGLAGAVALAAAGDETEFARIIRAHHDDVTRVCFVICGDLDVADEAVQAAWPIVWRKLGSLRAEFDSFWVITPASRQGPLWGRGSSTTTTVSDDRRVAYASTSSP